MLVTAGAVLKFQSTHANIGKALELLGALGIFAILIDWAHNQLMVVKPKSRAKAKSK